MSALLVETGARLHFGLLAVRAASGRQFGGCGVMVDGAGCSVRIEHSEQDEIQAPEPLPARIRHARDLYRESTRRQNPVRIEVGEMIPQHIGLGSGTQLALAIARGMAQLDGETRLDAASLARSVKRGRRSAIGLHGFDLGGFLVESGKRGDEISPVAVRLDFPSEWRFVLVRPRHAVGLSGDAELAQFAMMKPMPAATTDRLCRMILMDLLPSIGSGSFDDFSEGIYEYGRVVGEYFARVQGGPFADASMGELCQWLRPRGLRGIAQTSWGPTIAVACSSPDHADAVVLRLTDSPWADSLTQIVSPRNAGARVTVVNTDR